MLFVRAAGDWMLTMVETDRLPAQGDREEELIHREYSIRGRCGVISRKF